MVEDRGMSVPAHPAGVRDGSGMSETEGTGLWVCYCGEVAPWSWSFPHWNCQGGRPLSPEEITAREGRS